MPHLLDSITLLSAAASSALVNAVLEGAVLVALTAVILSILPSIRPASRFAVWIGVLAAAIALHFLPLRGANSGGQLASANAVHVKSGWAIALVMLWAAIAIFRISRLAISALQLRRLAATATPIGVAPQIAALLQGRRTAQLCSSADVDRPSVAGFLRPRVLIPTELLAHLSQNELEQIVMHEMEHIRRGDDWTNLLQKFGLALFPLNPALAWIDRTLCMERELACDDCVLSATSSRRSYALCLTNLAEHSFLRRNLSLTLGAWGKRSELARRVHRILEQPGRTLGRRAGFVVTGLMMAAILGGAASLSQIPSFVSFSVPSLPVATETGNTLSAQPVVQRGNFRPTMVKAVMPNPLSITAAPKASQPGNRTVPTKIVKPKHVIVPQQNLYVQTGFRPETDMPRVVLTVDRTTGSSYAAFSTGNGWLVIQL